MSIFSDSKKLQADLAAAQTSLTAANAELATVKNDLATQAQTLAAAQESIAAITAERDMAAVTNSEQQKVLDAVKAELDALKAAQKPLEEKAVELAQEQVAKAGFPSAQMPAEPNGQPQSSIPLDRLQAIHAQLATETDPAKRYALAKEANAILWKRAHPTK